MESWLLSPTLLTALNFLFSVMEGSFNISEKLTFSDDGSPSSGTGGKLQDSVDAGTSSTGAAGSITEDDSSALSCSLKLCLFNTVLKFLKFKLTDFIFKPKTRFSDTDSGFRRDNLGCRLRNPLTKSRPAILVSQLKLFFMLFFWQYSKTMVIMSLIERP